MSGSLSTESSVWRGAFVNIQVGPSKQLPQDGASHLRRQPLDYSESPFSSQARQASLSQRVLWRHVTRGKAAAMTMNIDVIDAFKCLNQIAAFQKYCGSTLNIGTSTIAAA